MEDRMDVQTRGKCKLEGHRVDLFSDLKGTEPAVVELGSRAGGGEVPGREPHFVAHFEGDRAALLVGLTLGCHDRWEPMHVCKQRKLKQTV